MNKLLIMYADYPDGLPYLDETCINNNLEVSNGICGVIVLDKHHVSRSTFWDENKIEFDSLRNYEIADILGYYSLEIMDSLGIHARSILKVDTDYFIYSKYILNQILNDQLSGVGTDVGHRLIGFDEFKNVHLVHRTRDSSPLVDIDVFRKYLDEAHTKDHYTATGPYMCMSEGLRSIEGLRPWTTNPGEWKVSGKYHSNYVFKSLGLHFQSSLLKEVGYEVTNIKCDTTGVSYNLRST